MDDLTCDTCGTDDHLRGERDGDVIHITCDACGDSWDRPLTPRCPTCGAEDLVVEKRPWIDKSRGTQLSIVGMTKVHLCRICDADEISREWRHIRPGEHPAK